ncbi:MAG: M56 family metallopeptidase [Ilyomonas sp.]
MQTIVLYMLKVVLISGILVSYYWIALRNKRFHYYNRFYLLLSILISVVLPLLQLNWFTWKSDNNKAISLLNAVTTNDLQNVTVTSKSNGIDWETFAAWAMIIISAFFIITCIIHILKIYRLKKIYPATKTGTFDFIQTDLKQAPFSFFKNLFWRNDIEVNSETGKQIFEHEYTHIKQKHSWDKLFMQLLLSFFWINPFFWLIRKELYLIHEFIADEKAVENKDASAFAAMLLQAQFGKNIYSPGQSFNYSPIKRRLLMLTNSKRTSYAHFRRVMVLPLLFFVICIFACKSETKEITQPTSNNLVSVNAKVQPLYVLDGKTIDSTEMKSINPNDIESIDVLKYKSATEKYGEKGKNGVVEIYLKDASEKVEKAVQIQAKFPGGIEAWTKYLQRNIKSEVPVLNKAPSGTYTVVVSFIVDKQGNLSDIKAENDPGFGTAAEAVRVISQGPKWIPAVKDERNVIFRQRQSITFQVEEQ